MPSKKAVIIGAGFGGLSLSCHLARDGWNVTLLEKNSMCGGRAQTWSKDGFLFDMGPSWYLMPEVFEDFFALFGKKREDYYKLVKLDPYYRVFFSKDDTCDVDSNLDKTKALFEKFEPGKGKNLQKYLDLSKYKYDVAMKEFLYKDYKTVFDFLNIRMMTEGLKLDIFRSLDKFVRRFFKDQRSRQILEYAMVFLGNSPYNAPALYSIMSHVDMNLGVWYPDGGINTMAKAMEKLALELGVTIRYNEEVTGMDIKDKKVVSVSTAKGMYPADLVVSNADYAFMETAVVPEKSRTYSKKYWDSRVWAPSMVLAYLGIDARLDRLAHHNLYFSKDWDTHFETIFNKPAWPEDPCYYVGCPSRTDPTVAPAGKENVFFLIPVSPELEDTDEAREKLLDRTLAHFEGITGVPVRQKLLVKRIFSGCDFSSEYNSYKGSALGISHTLLQTAIFRPAHRSGKVKNLYYSGHYNHPGVGMPMTVISSQITRDLVRKAGL